MAKYRVQQDCYITPARSAGSRYLKTDEEIEFDGEAPEILEAVGPGPHTFAPRKFDLPWRRVVGVGSSKSYWSY